MDMNGENIMLEAENPSVTNLQIINDMIYYTGLTSISSDEPVMAYECKAVHGLNSKPLSDNVQSAPNLIYYYQI